MTTPLNHRAAFGIAPGVGCRIFGSDAPCTMDLRDPTAVASTGSGEANLTSEYTANPALEYDADGLLAST